MFVCDKCNTTFTRIDNLKRHQKSRCRQASTDGTTGKHVELRGIRESNSHGLAAPTSSSSSSGGGGGGPAMKRRKIDNSVNDGGKVRVKKCR